MSFKFFCLVVVGPLLFTTVSQAQQTHPTAREIVGDIQKNVGVEWRKETVDTFKAGGMTVIQPDLESFRKPVLAGVPAKFESKWGKGTWERIAAL